MENTEQKKELTLEDIAELIRTTQVALEVKIESSVDGLAIITQNSVLKLEGEIKKLGTEIKEIKSDTENIETNLNKKVDKFTHNDLEYRVEKLEKKFA